VAEAVIERQIAVAALLLQRHCPVDKLDEAWTFLEARRLPTTMSELVTDVDIAVMEMNVRKLLGPR
jgi:hypothetical protein